MSMSLMFDRIIDCYFYIGDELAQTVTTPRRGIKPLIELEWSRVPGNFCYNAKLKITNLYTQWNFIDFTSVRIEAGYTSYSGKKTVALECQIFSTYKPLPGPDAAIFFECIVATANLNAFQAQPYNFLWYSKDATVANVVMKVGASLGIRMDMSKCSSKLLTQVWDDTQYTKNFTQGYSLLDYTQHHLAEIARRLGSSDVYMTIYGEVVTFAEVDNEGAIANSNMSADEMLEIPVLDQVNEVTWTAGTLSISAPFNPDVYPGAVFYCNPSVYSGGYALPNMVAKTGVQKDKSNMYYVITQTVSFATEGNMNSMKILAVPMSNSPLNLLTAKATAENLNALAIAAAEEAKKQKFDPINITFGSETIPEKDSIWSSIFRGSSTDYKIVKGDRLDSIAAAKFPAVLKGVKSDFKQVEIEGKFVGVPLICISTYNAYTNKSNTEAKWYALNTNNPLLVYIGNRLKIPSISSYASLAGDSTVANIYTEFANYCAKHSSMIGYIQPCKDIANLISEGTILDD